MVEYTYDAWGKLLSTTGTLATSLGKDNPLRYRGYYYDSDTGFYYLQSRYYDPVTGRFLNADDISYLGASGTTLSYNLFAYCENNPVNCEDIHGYFTIKIYAIAATTAAVIAAVAKIIGNYANGYRGWKLFRGVLGASIGSAVNIVLLMKLIKWGTKGMALAAFVAAAIQAVFDFAEGVLIDKKFRWKQLTYDFILNFASTLVGNYIGGKLVFINGNWIQPKKLGSFFTKSYGKRLISQTGIGAVINLLIDLIRGRLAKIS